MTQGRERSDKSSGLFVSQPVGAGTAENEVAGSLALALSLSTRLHTLLSGEPELAHLLLNSNLFSRSISLRSRFVFAAAAAATTFSRPLFTQTPLGALQSGACSYGLVSLAEEEGTDSCLLFDYDICVPASFYPHPPSLSLAR